MSTSERPASSPGPGLPHPIGASTLSPPQSDTLSLVESQVDIPASPASHSSWRDRRVNKAVDTVIHVAGDHALPIAAEALSVVPLPGLSTAARILDSIWKSLQLVQTNRLACLRLTERCADLLLAINAIVVESGHEVVEELKLPLETLNEQGVQSDPPHRRFSVFERFLKEQAELTFFIRYLKKDDILREIAECDSSVRDCLEIFNIAIQARILKQVLPSSTQDAPMLLGQVETNPPPIFHPSSVGTLDALNLVVFPADPASSSSKDDVSSLSEKLRQVQETENKADRARDLDDLGRILYETMNAPNHLEVMRILQIEEPDMPAAIMVLLRELERQQQQQGQQTNTTSGSPSPRIRALTWPLDGTPARALLHRQFIEFQLEAIRRTRNHYTPSTPPMITGTLRHVRSRTEIQIHSPSESEPSMSEYSATAISTPHHAAETRSFKVVGSSSANVSVMELDPTLDRPSDPFEAKTEICYRISISHAFHHLSASVPLWIPSPIEVGAVGYLLKNPAGAFRTLFNSLNPSGTSDGRLSVIAPLNGVTTVTEEHSGMKAKGRNIINKLTSAKSASIKRTYPISALADTAHLVAEKAKYQYFSNLDAPKKWFRTNVHTIMDIYQPECYKEELFLVFATVNTRDHALLVNHGGGSEPLEINFHVFSERKPGQPWGYFSGIPSDDAATGKTTSEVSEVGPTWNTVLLSRLRFRLDEQDPTTQ
ncbi:hypothetical protein B0H17DRAFT_1124900 [Mycena rosella]|uniref:Uncharacterized protein n=1 Tax=Mycena rosella TaxID=1033263 RepID=A0AAD7GYG7_MYCRO|nr:hypothetical protein B0H17DRAFT_1124900 [Mycena rosella]